MADDTIHDRLTYVVELLNESHLPAVKEKGYAEFHSATPIPVPAVGEVIVFPETKDATLLRQVVVKREFSFYPAGTHQRYPTSWIRVTCLPE